MTMSSEPRRWQLLTYISFALVICLRPLQATAQCVPSNGVQGTVHDGGENGDPNEGACAVTGVSASYLGTGCHGNNGVWPFVWGSAPYSMNAQGSAGQTCSLEFVGVGCNHFYSPPTGSGSCTKLANAPCNDCQGSFNITLHAKQGSFYGKVVEFPSLMPKANVVAANKKGATCGGATTNSDAAGTYDYNRNVTGVYNAQNWVLAVDGDIDASHSAGPGRRTYLLHTGPCEEGVYAELSSSEHKEVDLTVKPSGTEPPEMRCQRKGSKKEGPTPPDVLSAMGKPVSVLTGNMYFDQTDTAIPAIAALAFTRSYNSQLRAPGQYGALGMGWNHTFERRITAPSTGILMLRGGDGVPAYYQDMDGDLRYDASLPFGKEEWIVKQANGSYILYFRSGGTEAYDSAGRLTGVTDGVGNVTTLTRDGSGKLTTVAVPGPRTLSLTYDGSNRLSTLSGPAGLIVTYTYDPANRLTGVAYPGGSGYTFAYDSNNLLLTVVDGSGKTLETHTYDAPTGRALTSEISGGVEKYTFDYSTALETKVTDALGNVSTYEYGTIYGMRRVTKITGPCGSCGGGGTETQEWTYDSQGRVASYKDGLGDTTTYASDANGDMTSQTDAAGGVTSYTYDSLGRVLTVTGPDGSLTTKTYAAAGPLTVTEKVSASVNRTTTLVYNAQGKPTSITDPRGNVATPVYSTTLAYNSTGDLTSITDPLGHATTFEYDTMGRRTTVTTPSPLSHKTTTTYGGRGQVTRITNHDGTHTDFTYDLGGRRTTVTDPMGKVTSYGYDAYGRLETVTDPATGITTYGYDVMSQLTSLTDARGKGTSFEYDAYGRVKKVTYPGTPGPFETYTYDAAGHLVTRADRKNVVTTYAYDILGRLTGKTYSDTTPPVTYTYDAGGRLLTAGNGTDSLSFTYDLVGQLLSEGSTKNASSVAYTYDLGGNRLNVSLNGSIYLAYGFDDDSRLTSLTRGASVFNIGYDNANRRTSLTHPNGVSTAYTYDTQSRLTNLAATKPGTTITSSAYTYDNAGNRLTKAMPTHSETYTYDALYRLTNTSRAGTPTETYTYDAVGNRLSSLGGPTWSYGDRNELLSQNAINYTYDANGNLDSETNGSAWDYEWNAENQLTRALHDGVEVGRYAYDPLGRRVEKVAGGATTKYTYDGEDILRTIKGAETLKYVHGPGIDEPLAVDDGTRLVGYHADGLGSIVRTTDPFGTPTPTGPYAALVYDAFGNLGLGAPTLSVSQPALGFGTVTTGTSVDRTMTIRNSGGGRLQGTISVTGTGFTLVGPTTYDVATNQAPTLFVRFSPITAVSYTGTLTLTPNGGGTATTVALKGTGVAANAPTLSVNTTAAYGRQMITVTVANGPGNTSDWVGLYVWDAANTSYLAWNYLSGTHTQPPTGLTSATLTFDISATVNAYELRFFPNQGYTMTAASPTVAVQPLPPGPYAYTGREWDQETGLYYYRARYYDPKVGRFISEDPIRWSGGSVNLFGYVGNEPIGHLDPYGLKDCSVIPWSECQKLMDSCITQTRQDKTVTIIPPTLMSVVKEASEALIGGLFALLSKGKPLPTTAGIAVGVAVDKLLPDEVVLHLTELPDGPRFRCQQILPECDCEKPCP